MATACSDRNISSTGLNSVLPVLSCIKEGIVGVYILSTVYIHLIPLIHTITIVIKSELGKFLNYYPFKVILPFYDKQT